MLSALILGNRGLRKKISLKEAKRGCSMISSFSIPNCGITFKKIFGLGLLFTYSKLVPLENQAEIFEFQRNILSLNF